MEVYKPIPTVILSEAKDLGVLLVLRNTQVLRFAQDDSVD